MLMVPLNAIAAMIERKGLDGVGVGDVMVGNFDRVGGQEG